MDCFQQRAESEQRKALTVRLSGQGERPFERHHMKKRDPLMAAPFSV